jgi:CHC2 zinc finger
MIGGKEQARRVNDGPDEPNSQPQHPTSWPAPSGGFKPASEIGDPIDDGQVRELGFEPLRRGWRPLTTRLADVIEASVGCIGPGATRDPVPFRIPGTAECVVCGEHAPASTVGTPTCSPICVAVASEAVVPGGHITRGDGSGGTPPARPPAPPKPNVRPIPPGRQSVERALERLGSVRDVLERHGVDVRWGRTARCPLHDDEHPSMSLYERRGRSRAHCFPCGWDGDAIDLEAAIAGEDVLTTIRRWGAD